MGAVNKRLQTTTAPLDSGLLKEKEIQEQKKAKKLL